MWLVILYSLQLYVNSDFYIQDLCDLNSLTVYGPPRRASVNVYLAHEK